jgi:hypothetical protein
MAIGQEPPDGDFVAYLDMLQRESAARLNVAPVPIDTALAAAEAKRSGQAGHQGPTHVPVLDRQHDGGIVALAIGLGLIVWSASRIRTARAQRSEASAAPAQLSAVFGKRPGGS